MASLDAKVIAAKIAVEKIVGDLLDRRGLKSEWAQIDEDIQEEIKDAWTLIVLGAMG
jgi:hypothetical protein